MDSTPIPLPSDAAERRAARLRTPRLARELKTVAAMLQIYCRGHHGGAAPGDGHLCEACSGLLDYARKRLAACPFGPDKPTCANCRIHCYGARQREATRVVMRFAGPRMVLSHPLLALAHVIDGKRPAPPRPRGARSAQAGSQDPAAPG